MTLTQNNFNWLQCRQFYGTKPGVVVSKLFYIVSKSLLRVLATLLFLMTQREQCCQLRFVVMLIV